MSHIRRIQGLYRDIPDSRLFADVLHMLSLVSYNLLSLIYLQNEEFGMEERRRGKVDMRVNQRGEISV